MMKVGVWDFLRSRDWYPRESSFGILPMIVGSLAVTAGAMVKLGLPPALTAQEYTDQGIMEILQRGAP